MANKSIFNHRYFWGEIIFFLFFFLLGGPLSALEYHFYEGGAGSAVQTAKEVFDYMLYGLADLLPYTLFYVYGIRGLLFNKKFLWFAASLPAFLIFLNFCKLFTYWFFSHLTFLPFAMAADATRFLKSPVWIHFSIVYVLRDILALLALGYFIRSAEQDKKVADLGRIQAEAELGQLKGQLQPHYFFNTLNNIYALSIKQSPLTPLLIARHSEMMRYILYDSDKETVRLADEVRFLEALVAIEQVRQSGNKDIIFETQGIDEVTRIEPLMMLPFVENAFKHGIQGEIEAGYVKIILCRLEKELILEVRNSYGKELQSIDHAPGIGLENIRKRLVLLYPGRHTLTVNRDLREFRISLLLKLRA